MSFKDAVNQYNNYLPEGRKLTHNEQSRHYMKTLTAEFESEKIDIKNEENLKSKFAAVFGVLNVEGADEAFNATDIGYPDTIDKLRDKVHDKAKERMKIQQSSNLKSFVTIQQQKTGGKKRP